MCNVSRATAAARSAAETGIIVRLSPEDAALLAQAGLARHCHRERSLDRVVAQFDGFALLAGGVAARVELQAVLGAAAGRDAGGALAEAALRLALHTAASQ